MDHAVPARDEIVVGEPETLVQLAFAVTVGAIWSTFDLRSRLFHAGLMAWWVAAWIELVLSQRFSAE